MFFIHVSTSEGTNNATEPSLKDLLEGSLSHATHWKEIGSLLGVNPRDLKIIENDNMYRVQPCCRAMLEKWLEVDPDASWPKLFEAVNQIFIGGGENLEAGS